MEKKTTKKELSKKQRECCSGGGIVPYSVTPVTTMHCNVCGRTEFWEGNYLGKVYKCTCGQDTFKGTDFKVDGKGEGRQFMPY